MSILLPLQVVNGRLKRARNPKKAIDAFLELLLTTPCRSCVPDPQFGFVFNNLKFEVFNEKEGVIFNSHPTADEPESLYDKKVSGNSKSLNTFALELKKAIERYERRLSEVSVTMAYVKGQRKILISIEGIIVETGEAYRYLSSLSIWN